MPKYRKALSFICDKCGHKNFGDYTLEEEKNCRVFKTFSDNIYCTKCGLDNYIYEIKGEK